jgi:hypothetical protein
VSLHGWTWLAQKRHDSLWSADEWTVVGVRHEPEARIELVGAWKGCLQIAERIRLIGTLQHWGEQGLADAAALARRFDPHKCQIPMRLARMELLEGSEPSEQALRSAREYHADHSLLARRCQSCGGVWLWGIRRQPRSNLDEVAIVVGGVDLATGQYFLKDGAKECREGNAAPEAIGEEVREDWSAAKARVSNRLARPHSELLSLPLSTFMGFFSFTYGKYPPLCHLGKRYAGYYFFPQGLIYIFSLSILYTSTD